MGEKNYSVLENIFAESVKKAEESCLEMVAQKCRDTADTHREEFERVREDFNHGPGNLDKKFMKDNGFTKDVFVEKG